MSTQQLLQKIIPSGHRRSKKEVAADPAHSGHKTSKKEATAEPTPTPAPSINLSQSVHLNAAPPRKSTKKKKAVSVNDVTAEVAQDEIDFFRKSLPPSFVNRREMYEVQNEVAPLNVDEFTLGPKLGSGEFSNVYEVCSIALDENVAGSVSDCDAKRRVQLKSLETYRDTGKARYALKYLKESYLPTHGPEAYVQAAVDLALEAEMLSNLNHPHIMKLRGLALSGAAGFASGPCGYFLIMDRLFETLDRTIERWHGPIQERAPVKERPAMVKGRTKSWIARLKLPRRHTKPILVHKMGNGLMDDILSAALQLSAGMKYLHKHSIIFRDLKPDNIGFDVRGDLKIFDFGFARFLPDDGNPYNEKFEMTGAGSPRYMSPELLSGVPYNLKADVYTFAAVFWEMLSGEKPYAQMRSMDELVHFVVTKRGRPEIDEDWPKYVKDMLESSFDANTDKRPKMELFHDIIRKELVTLRRGDATGLSEAKILQRRTRESLRNVCGEAARADAVRQSVH